MSVRDLGYALIYQGKTAQAQRYAEQSLRICRETGDRRDEGWALFALGTCALYRGDSVAALDYYARCLSLMHETDPVGEASVLSYAGLVSIQLGDYARAQGFLERSLQVGKAHRHRKEVDQVLVTLALASIYLGDVEGAWAALQRAQKMLQDPGERYSLTFVLLGHTLTHLGHLAEAADAYRQAAAVPWSTAEQTWITELLAGRARVCLAQGEPGAALAFVHEILDQIETDPTLPVTLEPCRTYLTCYHVLRANEDPRAGPILRAAYRLLHEKAARLEDPAQRRTFLENVAAHREIVAEWQSSRRSGGNGISPYVHTDAS